jgi:hypothetical protein
VAESFAGILAGVTLAEPDISAFETHRARIESSLRSSFNLSKVVCVGSYARGSAIRLFSDLDLFVVLRRRETDWGGRLVLPNTILTRLRTALQGTFPQSFIGRDGQAVVIKFSDGREVDVVPARFDDALESGWPLYRIPSDVDHWLATSPELHNKYIAEGNERAGGKLKSVVRILKYWKVCRVPQLPLNAFHLELLLAKHGTCNGGRTLAQCVADALSLVQQRSGRALQDPCSISGNISAAATNSKVDRLVAAVCASAGRAQEAVRCESFGNIGEALRLWGLVFNGRFP